MAEEWFTAKELADRALDGLPATERGIQLRADREGWRSRERTGKGGGREYHVSALPEAARTALYLQDQERLARWSEVYAPTPSDLTGRDLGDMTEVERKRSDAYLDILAALQDWRLAHPKASKFDGYAAFSALYNARKIDLPEWVYDTHKSVSKNTLYKQETLRAQGSLKAMGGRYGNRKGTGVFDRCEPLRKLVVGLINTAPHLGPKMVREVAKAELGEMVELRATATLPATMSPLPSVKSFERFIADWTKANKAVHASIVDPDKHRGALKFAPGNMYSQVVRRNQLWEIDASPADALCLDGRYSIYVLIDVYTRWPKVRVTRTPKTEAALLLVRDGILDWGFGETLKTDNGSDFISGRFRDTVRRLGIVQDVCAPFSPEQKAAVERCIGTLQHSFMELQPGYIGHSVADRKVIEARKSFATRLGQSDADAFCVELTGQQLQDRLNEWIDHVYAHQPHEGLGGKTPFQVRAAYRGRISRLSGDGAGALDYLLMAPPDKPTRVMGKKGVQVNNIDYYLREAVVLPGTQVHVRLDPDDLGRIYLYTDNPWTFVGVAVNPERLGLDRAEVAAEVKAAEAAVLAESKKAVREDMRGINLATMSEKMIRQGKVHSASVVAFPEASVPASTPDLDAAAVAVRMDRSGPHLEAAPERPEEAVRREVIEADFKKASTPPEDPAAARFERALAAERKIAAGETVAEAEWTWLTRYRETPEYRARKRGLEDIERFGAAPALA